MFKSDMLTTLQYSMDGKFLFYKFSVSESPKYIKSLIPGYKKGISGSSIGGYNIGINKFSEVKKRDSIIKTYEFLTSKKVQKDLIMNYGINSGIRSLYDDEEVCKSVDCEIIKNIQLFRRPNFFSIDYDTYSQYFRIYIYEFLYGNKTAYEVLKKIDDITKIYKISIYGDNATIALISNISLFCIIIFMLLSVILLYCKKYKSYFNFLSNDFWFLTIIGIICILCPGILENGSRNTLKCELSLLFPTIGSTLILIPILHKLIVNFPEKNKFTIWITDHKFIFLFLFISIDIIQLLLLQNFYTIKQISPKVMGNFEICKLKNNIITYIDIISLTMLKVILLFIILLLIYIEWNLKKSYYDLRFTVLAIYTDILFLIILIIIKSLNITNYIYYYIINTLLYLIFSIFNYIILFFSRIIMTLLKKDNEEISFIKDVNKQFINNETSILSTKIDEMNDSQNQSKSSNNKINSSMNDNHNVIKNTLNSNESKDTIIKKIYSYHNNQFSSSNICNNPEIYN